jgi:hypothetical protein
MHAFILLLIDSVVVVIFMSCVPVKDRKWRPEGGEWEPQISFKTFDHGSKINPKGTQIKNTKTRATES